MAEVAFSFGVPALPDLVDPSVNYNLAVRFTSSETHNCVGIDWYVPATPPTGNCSVQLWNVGTEVRLAAKTVSFAGQGGTLVRTYFDTPVEITASTQYAASIHTPNRYVATTSYTWPHTDGILTAIANNGWLAFLTDPSSGVDVFPNIQSGNAGNYHVSPVLETAAATTPIVGSDTGRLVETAAGLVVALASADAGRGADIRSSLAVVLAGADVSPGREGGPSGAATLAGVDVGRLLEVGTLVAAGQLALSGADTARLAELADVVVVGLDHGHITDRTVTRSRAIDRTATRAQVTVRGLD